MFVVTVLMSPHQIPKRMVAQMKTPTRKQRFVLFSMSLITDYFHPRILKVMFYNPSHNLNSCHLCPHQDNHTQAKN
jgi:hypothetical protein